MKKLVMLLAVLLAGQSCFSMENENDSLVENPSVKILQAIANLDVESLKNLAGEYAQTCVVCNQPVNVLQALPFVLSTSKNNKEIIAQIRKLEDLVQSEEPLQDLEAGDEELIQFSFHKDCELQVKKLFLENPGLSNCIIALIGTGLCLGLSSAFASGLIYFLGVQKSCEGEDGMYHCHPC